MAQINLTQYDTLAARTGITEINLGQFIMLNAFGPLATRATDVSQIAVLAAQSAGVPNVSVDVAQMATLVAYGTGEPLGPEGDWAYDTTTEAWCQLKTDGFNGLNFTNGVMWGLRIMGGDQLYPYLYEMDPNQVLDEDWRPITHIVTGGVPLRGRYNVGVSNFTLTASVGDVQSIGETMSLSFSDDNGNTWSPDFDIELTGVGSQKLIWNALGSFTSPGRVFKITDAAGPVRIDGADVVLSGTTGEADSGEGQES